jgi:thioredoxin-related protein
MLKTNLVQKSTRNKKKYFFDYTVNKLLILGIFIMLNIKLAIGQEDVKWIDFEDLSALQAQDPKPMFIYIYADWCVYCKKMEKVSFKEGRNVELLNQNYYTLKFNLETDNPIIFKGKKFENQELKTHRQPKHDLAKYLTGREDQIPLPAIVILDQNYNLVSQLNTYLSPKQLYLLINQ